MENTFINVLSNIKRFAIKIKIMTQIIKNNDYKSFLSLYLLGLISGFMQKNNNKWCLLFWYANFLKYKKIFK